MAKLAQKTFWRGAGTFALSLLALFFAIIFIRMIAVGSWDFMILALIIVVLSLLGAVILFNDLDQVFTSMYLYRAAEQVADLLNTRPGRKFGPVRYVIIGHDHAARVWELENLRRRFFA